MTQTSENRQTIGLGVSRWGSITAATQCGRRDARQRSALQTLKVGDIRQRLGLSNEFIGRRMGLGKKG
jgi:hypothetical protein